MTLKHLFESRLQMVLPNIDIIKLGNLIEIIGKEIDKNLEMSIELEIDQTTSEQAIELVVWLRKYLVLILVANIKDQLLENYKILDTQFTRHLIIYKRYSELYHDTDSINAAKLSIEIFNNIADYLVDHFVIEEAVKSAIARLNDE